MSSTTNSLTLVIRLSDGAMTTSSLRGFTRVPAAASATYALVDGRTGESPRGLRAKRDGDHLLVEDGRGTPLLLIEYFYIAPDSGFMPDASLRGEALIGTTLDAGSPGIAARGDEEVIWQAAGNSGAGGGGGGGAAPWLWGGGIAAGLLAMAGGGGGGGGDSDPDPTPPATPPPTPPPVAPANNQVTGRIVAGPVMEGNGLSVSIYQADGETLLGTAKVADDGSFTVNVGSYIGAVIARVTDADAGVDYLDEATGAAKDLNAQLSAVEVISVANSTVVMNINALTTLASELALRAAGTNPLTAATVNTNNQAVAELFGIPALHDTEVEPTNGGNFNHADGLSPAEQYGAILAALSGADQLNGGDSQATINQILEGLSVSASGEAILAEDAQVIFVEGAEVIEEAGDLPSGAVSVVIDTFPPQFQSSAEAPALDEESGSGQVIYTAIATDAGPIQFSLKDVGDYQSFTINAENGEVVLSGNPDFETKSSYSFTIVATDSAGNSSEQPVTLAINDVDESSPVINSGGSAIPIAENSGGSQVVYTASAVHSAPVTFSLKAVGDFASFNINPTSGAVALIGNPDFEAKSSYSFTVVATAADGKFGERTVALNIGNVDEVAPAITSGDTGNPIEENSGAGQVVYTATADDSADISGGVAFSLKPVGDHAAFSINASTGNIRLTANPDFEAQSSYSFTVVATDAAGFSVEKAVTLAVVNLDEVAPTITSADTATPLNENSGAGQVVYTASADDTADISDGVAFSLKPAGDHAAFAIDATTGAVTLSANPNYATKSSYSFTVVATDAAGNAAEKEVTLAIVDVDEEAPVFVSGFTAAPINENSGAGQVVYTADAEDATAVAYSLKAVSDHASFTIDAATGDVTLAPNPDFETKNSYAFTIIATDTVGNTNERAVTLAINNLDEAAPIITSSATAAAKNENSGAGQIVYTVTADDSDDISGGLAYSLKPVGDYTAFSINAGTGAVTLIGNPDFEAKSSYSFTVVATDAAGFSAEQAVSLAINNLDEVAPSITSSDTATPLNENSGAGQVVYTVSATDAEDISNGVAYSLKPVGDYAAFAINAASGAVTLSANPNYAIKSSYSFTVVATDAAGNAAEKAVTLAIVDVDEEAPIFNSGAIADPIDENSGSGQVVYTADAEDATAVAYSLKAVDDQALFSIDATSGEVTLTANPDFETKASYAFTVIATDTLGNSNERAVTLAINNLDESPPSITSGATATAINENSGAGQVVYTAAATDDADISGGVTFSLKAVGDHGSFSITDADVVTLSPNPDFETKPSYSFTVVATDAAGNSSEQAVTLQINDLDDTPPVFTSAATANAIAENSGAGQIVYTAAATDASALLYSLKTVGDHSLFSINAATGAVTLTANPDYENKSSYDFTVVATDAAGNSAERAVTLAINNLDEAAPDITSGPVAAAINENSGAGQVIYTVTADDGADISGGVTFSLKAVGDYAALSINGGAVTLTANPDYEAKSSYAFTVVATDAAGNSSEQEVTLAINNLDEVAPTITSDTIADAIDENSGAGQVIYTVTATDFGDVSNGLSFSLKPVGDYTAFSIDASTGQVSLTADPDFETKSSYAFTVIATDAAGNASEKAVTLAINDIDDTPPTLVSSTPEDNDTGVTVGSNIVLTFSENVSAGSGNITLSDGNLDVRSIAVTDATQVTFNGNQVTINPTADLNPGANYHVQIANGAIVDAAGNPFAGINDQTSLNFETVDTSIVVFDLVEGVTSNHSNRTFQSNIDYTIYIRVDSDSASLSTDGIGPGPSDSWGVWFGAANLSSNDKVVLVGNGSNVRGVGNGSIASIPNLPSTIRWETVAFLPAANLFRSGFFIREYNINTDATDLWTGFAPINFVTGQDFQINTMHRANMPLGVLTSQGLA